jgi:hypothetical protein
MQVEITVKVDGKLVKRHVAAVDGTLRDMEAVVDELSRQVARDTLQASVEQLPAERPLFRTTAAAGGTAATPRAPSSG